MRGWERYYAATVLAEARREVLEAERPKLDEATREDDGSPTTHLLAEATSSPELLGE